MARQPAPGFVPLWRRPTTIGAAALLLLLVAAFLDTTFVSTSSIAQPADTAKEYADLNFEKVVIPTILDKAQPLDELVAGLVKDANATGEEFGSREDDGKPWSFATDVTGTVAEGEFGEFGLQVEGLPQAITVGVAVPPLGSDTSIRNAGTDLSFGDFVNQTEYQTVAIELNKRITESVYGEFDPASFLGKKIRVVGAFTWVSKTGGEIDHVTIIPVKIEAAG